MILGLVLILFLSSAQNSPLVSFSAQLAPSRSTVGISSWTAGPVFPAGNIEVGAAGAYNGVLYYIGGEFHPSGAYTNGVYYSDLSSSGMMGAWKKSPHPYPGAKGIWALPCPAYNGFVYCIGGNKVPGGTTDAVYYTTVSTSGLGSWRTTTTYPINIRFESCVPYAAYMYCVGGSPSANGATDKVYYAPILSSGGLAGWSATTSYPIGAWSHCVADSGFIYCLSDYNGAAIANLTYYAPISSSGIGAWHQGPDYPITKEKMQCMETMNSMICVGGGNGLAGTDGTQGVDNVYVSALSSAGLGAWTQTTNYPLAIKDHSCATYNNYVYCVGGDDPKTTNLVYYGEVT